MYHHPVSNGYDAASGLEIYLGEIRGDALLSADEECTLAHSIALGDNHAKEHLIRSNLRLVIKISRDYLGRGLALEDLIGEGNIGLIRASEEFDPSFGVRFSTYAAHWIKQAIRHALTNTTATIRLPAHMVNLLSKWRKTERTLRRELGTDPNDDQIADRLGLSAAQREMVRRARLSSRVCRETSVEDQGHAWSIDETPDSHESPDAALEVAEDRLDVLRRLDRLDDRERLVVALRFGLDDQSPLTLKEIGQRLGVTREWVRKIESRAVRKLDDSAHPAQPSKSPTRRRSPSQAHSRRTLLAQPA
ncbi:MAG: RNA polymerase sigma factor RpoD/SigA [Isosphaeraceae bacterium]